VQVKRQGQEAKKGTAEFKVAVRC